MDRRNHGNTCWWLNKTWRWIQIKMLKLWNANKCKWLFLNIGSSSLFALLYASRNMHTMAILRLELLLRPQWMRNISRAFVVTIVINFISNWVTRIDENSTWIYLFQIQTLKCESIKWKCCSDCRLDCGEWR